jgi:hypothetical protein
MNPRHAAALALVGWYLMILPTDRDRMIAQFYDVPWSAEVRSFDTAKDCEEARAKAVVAPTAVKGQPELVGPTATPTPVNRAFYCIEGDDPRLKALDISAETH